MDVLHNISEVIKAEKAWYEIGANSKKLYQESFTPVRQSDGRYFDRNGKSTPELGMVRTRLKHVVAPGFFRPQDVLGIFVVGGHVLDLERAESDLDILIRTVDQRWPKGELASVEYLRLLASMNPQETELSLRHYLTSVDSRVLTAGKRNFVDVIVDNREMSVGYDLVTNRWVKMHDNFMDETLRDNT